MGAFKPLATFELELKSRPQSDNFDVLISGTTPKGDTKPAKVGTISNQVVKVRRGTLLEDGQRTSGHSSGDLWLG